MLISDIQLCLAHYCDVHGPTPLMVTEGLPVPCSACYEDELIDYPGPSDDRPRTSAHTSGAPEKAVTEALRRISLAGVHRSSSVPASDHEVQTYRAALLRAAQAAGSTGSAIETPPQSPRLPNGPGSGSGMQPQKARHDSGFRRTYDDYVTQRAGPCENCALTLPRRQEDARDVGVDSRQTERSPTLRTRAPCARVYGVGSGGSGMDSVSPPTSRASSSSPSDDETAMRPRHSSHRRTGTTVSVTSRSSASSAATSGAHTHYLDYTSTHEPVAPNSFSIVRASCLRTLSFETLPRAPATGPLGSPTSTPGGSPSQPAFVTTHSAGSAASGGPIFFGDPIAGYTTAYIFRIPDVHARGHKRVYAFLALSTHRERLAMKTFGFIAAAFRDMAAWIQALAEAEAERTLAESSGSGSASTASSPVVAGPGYGSFQSEPATFPSAAARGGGSSFLGGMGGLSRRMGAGYGGSGVALKQRGLAELVGLPDFFIELHTRFVRLLLELGVVLGS
ncbi:folliculin [Diplogelasinospora grovesii]|uniref:Folliculin n=1 Tax=Diplogelasinospora grovesii TaxID=303347 RepID=A0AAN6S5M7_9PEZI|nr:folliculin [Diplogelasinospora grovesii]